MTKTEAKRGYIIHRVMESGSGRVTFDPEFLRGHVKFLRELGYGVSYYTKKEEKHRRLDWNDYWEPVFVTYAEVSIRN